MDIKIKFCGIRRKEDALMLNAHRPDYAGFVFAKSKRRVSLETAYELREILAPEIKTVGVFVNEPLEKMPDFARAVSAFQLHGDENEEYILKLREILPADCEIWKAVRVKNREDIENAQALPVDKLLFDAFSESARGGTGKRFDWELLNGAKLEKPFFLSGGISAENFREAMMKVKPFGADISSGIETDGYKDEDKIIEILRIADMIGAR